MKMHLAALCTIGLCACSTWSETFSETSSWVPMTALTQPEHPTHVEIELQRINVNTAPTCRRRHRCGGGCIIAAPPLHLDFKASIPNGHIFSVSLPQICITDSTGQELYTPSPYGGLLINPPPSPVFDEENVIQVCCHYSESATVHVNGVAVVEYSGVLCVHSEEHGYTHKPTGQRQKASIPFSFKANLLNGEQSAYRFLLPNAPAASGKETAR